MRRCDAPQRVVCGWVPLIPHTEGEAEVLAESPAIRALLERAARSTGSDAPVVVHARSTHAGDRGPRALGIARNRRELRKVSESA